VARQSAGRRRVDESAVEENDEVLDEVEADEEEASRSDATNELWQSVRVDVVEIALPKGVGYTLRAYRPERDVIPTDVSEREPELFPDRHRTGHAYVVDEKAIVDDEDEFDEDAETDTGRSGRAGGAARAGRRGGRAGDEDDRAADDEDIDEDDEDEDEYDEEDEYDDEEDDEDLTDEYDVEDDETDEDESAGEDDEDESADEDDDAVDDDAEPAGDSATANVEEPDVPIFLGGRGQVYLFRSPEGLVEYVRSGAQHDMSQLTNWADLVARITPEDVVPLPDDRYELDLVVENLRAGHQAWDPELVIRAGEVARDLGYALQLEQVQASLSPGSPLDDLDEAMRAAAAGGIGGFMARRRLKKIGAEAAPLGWRTIIGKISAAVDWRD
jgi:hypothetical protein